jgi:hypothetical protein
MFLFPPQEVRMAVGANERNRDFSPIESFVSQQVLLIDIASDLL